ncbi:BnaC06g00210D [Brassica napus]|uniref:(rape) hypothetical protein n=1 Tax=Brassica napus TaxID=3708 RepID=A0A078FXL2_BRANA|nr:unnamed protein product [Brassica napus]CDY17088.1 BnaC06g00210D [Brassica napus]
MFSPRGYYSDMSKTGGDFTSSGVHVSVWRLPETGVLLRFQIYEDGSGFPLPRGLSVFSAVLRLSVVVVVFVAG